MEICEDGQLKPKTQQDQTKTQLLQFLLSPKDCFYPRGEGETSSESMSQKGRSSTHIQRGNQLSNVEQISCYTVFAEEKNGFLYI